MIEAALERLESSRAAEAQVGLDEAGEVLWRQSAGDLLDAVAAWQALLHGRGVAPGDRVAVELPRGPELLPAHLAALACGACVVPINPALPAADRARVLERARVAALLEHEDERPAAGGAVSLAAHDGPALLIFTSGTTGEPKGVPHTRANLEANLDALARTWALRPGEPLLHTLPAHHVHGLVLALYGSARIGMPIFLMPRFDAARALHALARHEIGVFMGVPTMYHRMCGAAEVPEAFPRMRVFVSGSAPLSPDDFAAFEARFGFAPLERYGLTETLIVTSNPLEAERIPGTVGRALPGTEVRLAPDGEIEVRGPGVMHGYWEDAGADALSFRDGWFRTGDVALREDGSYRILGRNSVDIIKTGGYKVSALEIEEVLRTHPALRECTVVGVPDPDWGERVCAAVICRDPAPLTLEALRAWAKERLAPYKVPSRLLVVEALPQNVMGKVTKPAVKALFEERRDE